MIHHPSSSCQREDDMAQGYLIESAIHQQLARAGTCSLDQLTTLLPGYSWGQVFAAVDRMTREGSVTLKHPAPFRYLLSLAPRQPAERAM
jgi:hypothetical protein